MQLADIEVFHNRPFSPTRRVALGRRELPVDPPPGTGAILLGAIVAVGAEDTAPDDRDRLRRLVHNLEHGHRIPQPQVRHRFQADTQGLARTHARLVVEGEELTLDVDGDGSPLQLTVASVYAAGQLPAMVRSRVFDVIRIGLAWRGPVGASLFRQLSGGADLRWQATAFADPRLWAYDVLGLDAPSEPGRDDASGTAPTSKDVQKRFRALLRQAHPDHGAGADDAAERIADLTEARRILLG